jgi:Mn2+/Fe2+ NRAMP family transporter
VIILEMILSHVQRVFCQVITLTSSRRIMGSHFVNSLATQLGAWVVASFIIGVNGCAWVLAEWQ